MDRSITGKLCSKPVGGGRLTEVLLAEMYWSSAAPPGNRLSCADTKLPHSLCHEPPLISNGKRLLKLSFHEVNVLAQMSLNKGLFLHPL